MNAKLYLFLEKNALKLAVKILSLIFAPIMLRAETPLFIYSININSESNDLQLRKELKRAKDLNNFAQFISRKYNIQDLQLDTLPNIIDLNDIREYQEYVSKTSLYESSNPNPTCVC